MQSHRQLKKGELVGWKFRAALVLGHVDHVDAEEDMVYAHPMAKGTSMVHRHREKVLTQEQMDPADVQLAMKRGGHMPRTVSKSKGRKAEAMGLSKPTQLMPEGQAVQEKKKRSRAYEQEEVEVHGKEAAQARGKASKRARK